MTRHPEVTQQPDATTEVARRFPLVPRPKPRAAALADRLTEIHTLTDTAHHNLADATEALNKAALIASDLGAPNLARDLCWRHYDALHTLGPHPAITSTAILQPLVNLGRLEARAGNPDNACHIYETLHRATTEQQPMSLAGRTIDLTHHANNNPARHNHVQFTWSVLLADGTQTLTRAGRWHDALELQRRHRGIGTRMLHGRQTLILFHTLHDDLTTAIDIINNSSPRDIWEHAVTHTLRTYTHHAHDSHLDPSPMIAAYCAIPADGNHGSFLADLGMTVLDIVLSFYPHWPVKRSIVQGCADKNSRIAEKLSMIENLPKCRDLTAHLRANLGTLRANAESGTRTAWEARESSHFDQLNQIAERALSLVSGAGTKR